MLSGKQAWSWASIMAYEDIKTEYHLTSDGWKIGNPPADRIETWICHKYQASGYSRTLISWRCTWADPAGRQRRRPFCMTNATRLTYCCQ
jgi:hypothetical protein